MAQKPAAAVLPCSPQVNITLLDINDNYPTWKDEPYFINLVEMTPPNSDVTTVRVRLGDAGAGGHLQTGVTSVTFSPAPSLIPFKTLLLSLPTADHPLCFFSLLWDIFFPLSKLCGFWPNPPFLSLACDLLQGPL